MPIYRVQIIGAEGEVSKELEVFGRDPDEAAQHAFGEPLVRGAKGPRKTLCAKVYWANGGTPTMARFYRSEPEGA